jgi:hypothetical protein
MKFVLLFIICLLSAFFSNIQAQTIVEGKITEKGGGKPVSDVIVTVGSAKGDNSYAYCISDKQGGYRLSVKENTDSLWVVFKLLGYELRTIAISNKSQNLNVILEQKDFQLKEVTIKPTDISRREDTLNFSVTSFVRNQDRSIGDVLRRLPGIEETSSGAIKYNGENINNYYIEGLNLLGNKYSIANRNISPQDIVNIQVIENHQPVNTLKGVVFSNQAAINLQLKKDRIAQPIGNVEVGTGFSPLLWNLNTFGMEIGRTRQTIVTYKTNNAGKDIASELNQHKLTMDDFTMGNALLPDNLVSPPLLSSPPTKKNRYLLNKTHVVSINHLRKIGEDSQLRLNISYLNDEQKQKNSSQSSYYFAFADTNLIINESNVSERYNNQADAELTYTNNAREYYLNDALKFSGAWNLTNAKFDGANSVFQHFYTPLVYVQNEWSMIKKVKSRILQFSSFIRYANLPQQLNARTDSVSGEMVQHVRLANFYTNNSTGYGFLWRRSSLVFDFNLQAFADKFNSSLENPPLPVETGNRLQSSGWILKLNPKYQYLLGRMSFNLSLPVSFNAMSVTNQMSGKKQPFSIWLITPNFSMDYKWNGMLGTSLSYNFNRDIGDVMDFADAYIMSDYRSFYRKSGVLSRRNSRAFSFKTKYSNQIEALFANVAIGFRKTTTNLLSKTDFTGFYSLSESIEAERFSEFRTINGNIGKYVRALKTTFSLTAIYMNIESQYMQQNSELLMENKTLTLIPKIDMKINEKMNFVYNFKYFQNNTAIKTMEKKYPPLKQISQSLAFNIFPTGKWKITSGLEHFYNRRNDGNTARLFFADLGVSLKTKHIEYTLDWNNIFDQRSYSYESYDGPNIFSSRYDLRPMNLLFNVIFKY